MDSESHRKIIKAIKLALSLHADQEPRPDGPYNYHILRVVGKIIYNFKVRNPDIIIATALHDSVEDQSSKLACLISIENLDETEKALEYIRQNFGQRVAEIVKAVSNPESWHQLPTVERYKKYALHVKKIIQDPDVCLVKLADFMDNGLTIKKINNPERQLTLAQKYVPVYTIFINRIAKDDIELSSDIKEEIIELLSEGKSYTESILKKLNIKK